MQINRKPFDIEDFKRDIRVPRETWQFLHTAEAWGPPNNPPANNHAPPPQPTNPTGNQQQQQQPQYNSPVRTLAERNAQIDHAKRVVDGIAAALCVEADTPPRNLPKTLITPTSAPKPTSLEKKAGKTTAQDVPQIGRGSTEQRNKQQQEQTQGIADMFATQLPMSPTFDLVLPPPLTGQEIVAVHDKALDKVVDEVVVVSEAPQQQQQQQPVAEQQQQPKAGNWLTSVFAGPLNLLAKAGGKVKTAESPAIVPEHQQQQVAQEEEEVQEEEVVPVEQQQQQQAAAPEEQPLHQEDNQASAVGPVSEPSTNDIIPATDIPPTQAIPYYSLPSSEQQQQHDNVAKVDSENNVAIEAKEQEEDAMAVDDTNTIKRVIVAAEGEMKLLNAPEQAQQQHNVGGKTQRGDNEEAAEPIAVEEQNNHGQKRAAAVPSQATHVSETPEDILLAPGMTTNAVDVVQVAPQEPANVSLPVATIPPKAAAPSVIPPTELVDTLQPPPVQQQQQQPVHNTSPQPPSNKRQRRQSGAHNNMEEIMEKDGMVQLKRKVQKSSTRIAQGSKPSSKKSKPNVVATAAAPATQSNLPASVLAARQHILSRQQQLFPDGQASRRPMHAPPQGAIPPVYHHHHQQQQQPLLMHQLPVNPSPYQNPLINNGMMVEGTVHRQVHQQQPQTGIMMQAPMQYMPLSGGGVPMLSDNPLVSRLLSLSNRMVGSQGVVPSAAEQQQQQAWPGQQQHYQ